MVFGTNSESARNKRESSSVGIIMLFGAYAWAVYHVDSASHLSFGYLISTAGLVDFHSPHVTGYGERSQHSRVAREPAPTVGHVLGEIDVVE